jgi:hypothetical protein
MARISKLVTAALGVVILIVVACLIALELGLPIGGLSRDQAIRAASRQIASTTPASVRMAIPGPLILLRAGEVDAVSPSYRMVWAITFNGTYEPASCGPFSITGSTQRCPPSDHTATVYVDYVNGTFIMATIGP